MLASLLRLLNGYTLVTTEAALSLEIETEDEEEPWASDVNEEEFWANDTPQPYQRPPPSPATL